jgi:Fur family iron response transcriptional regulator
MLFSSRRFLLYRNDMTQFRHPPSDVERLRLAGLRPTRQRLALAALLFAGPHRHVTAEQLYGEAIDHAIGVSLATIYNTLNQFTQAGLLRELILSPGCSYFDTNVDDHHHFYFEDSGKLADVPYSDIVLANLPSPPRGSVVSRVDVVIRLTGRSPGKD